MEDEREQSQKCQIQTKRKLNLSERNRLLSILMSPSIEYANIVLYFNCNARVSSTQSKFFFPSLSPFLSCLYQFLLKCSNTNCFRHIYYPVFSLCNQQQKTFFVIFFSH